MNRAIDRNRYSTTAIVLFAAVALAGCGESASKTARDNDGIDQTTAGMPPAGTSPAGMVPTDIAPPSTDLPSAPAAVGNPSAPADPGSPSDGTVTPPAGDASYDRGAGNANVGPGNDGSPGTQPSGSNNEANQTRREQKQ